MNQNSGSACRKFRMENLLLFSSWFLLLSRAIFSLPLIFHAWSQFHCNSFSAPQNFCTVTGQSNWCEEDNECTEDKTKACPIEHWCVCEWAFSSYLQEAGGCNQSADVICDATNQNALLHYEGAIAGGGEAGEKAQNALNCLKSKCNLS